MHARTIITHHRFRHEGCGFAIAMGDHMHDIFIELHLISNINHGRKFHAQFMLRWGDLMMMFFHFHAQIIEHSHHFGTQILSRIHWRNGKITALHARTMGIIAAFHIITAGIGSFLRANLIHAMIHIILNQHIIKHEKFCFGTKKCCITNIAFAHKSQCLFRN